MDLLDKGLGLLESYMLLDASGIVQVSRVCFLPCHTDNISTLGLPFLKPSRKR